MNLRSRKMAQISHNLWVQALERELGKTRCKRCWVKFDAVSQHKRTGMCYDCATKQPLIGSALEDSGYEVKMEPIGVDNR